VENVEDVLGVGQKVQVEIGEIDPRGKLSLHAVVEEPAEGAESGDGVATSDAETAAAPAAGADA
jgi:polyribonucleotide nucleotidyltransferase